MPSTTVLLAAMKVHKIRYADTGRFSNIVTDYLSQREDFKGFYNRFPSREAFSEQMAERSGKDVDRELLHEVIAEQYANLELTAAQKNNLTALKAQDAFTITTGHQLCLFTGPLYFVYKIASIIRLAERVEKEHNKRVIPIFWLATEDHDFEEVNHARLYGKEVKWESGQTGPVGRMNLDGIEESLDSLAGILGEGERALSLMKVLRKAYSSTDNLAAATRAFVQHLFAEYGLLCLDADDHRLKKNFAPIMKQELMGGIIENATADAIAQLENRGSKVQAKPRDINLFYINEAGRWRISREGKDYRIVDTDLLFSAEDLLKMLENEPERFSPNVLFRPIYQEFILPNLATIGGGGELAYWMELKGAFSAFDVVMPILFLRASHLIIDYRSMARWEEAGFGLSDFWRPLEQLQKEFSLREGGEEVDILEEKERMLASFDRIVAKSKAVDPNMMKFTEAEQARLRKSVETIEKKLIRAEKKKHETALSRVEAVQEKFFPGGGLQERSENIIPFLIKYGHEIIDRLVKESDVMEGKFTVMLES